MIFTFIPKGMIYSHFKQQRLIQYFTKSIIFQYNAQFSSLFKYCMRCLSIVRILFLIYNIGRNRQHKMNSLSSDINNLQCCLI